MIYEQRSSRGRGERARTPGWISDRTGHPTPEITQRYDRGARSLADLQLVPFPDISETIPELRNVRGLRVLK
jgi:hypothetical protein